jgi:hypothetical protein
MYLLDIWGVEVMNAENCVLGYGYPEDEITVFLRITGNFLQTTQRHTREIRSPCYFIC